MNVNKTRISSLDGKSGGVESEFSRIKVGLDVVACFRSKDKFPVVSAFHNWPLLA